MVDARRIDPKHAMQVAGLAVTACVVTNLAFYFLSGMYFEDRAAQFGVTAAGEIGSVRVAFAVFTGSVSLAAILAVLAPWRVGHVIPAVVGALSLVSAIGAFGRGMTPVLGAALLVIGIALPLLTWRSLSRSRAAWSMLISMCAVYGVVLLFGSPKVREILGIGLWSALIVPGMLAVATVALAMVRDRYREQS